MKNRLPLAICGALLATSSITMAAQTASTAPQHAGFHFGVNGAVGFGSVNSQGTYTAPDQEKAATLNETTNMPTGKIGASIGYGFNIDNSNQLDLTFNYSHYLSLIKQTILISSTAAAQGSAFDINQKIRPQSQFNFEINGRHFISLKSDVRINAGLSILRLQNKYSIQSLNPAVITAATGGKQTKTLFGGLLGVGFDYYLSQHSAISANVNYFIYASGSLKSINSVDDDQTDSITKRKINFSIPEISLGYNYYF